MSSMEHSWADTSNTQNSSWHREALGEGMHGGVNGKVHKGCLHPEVPPPTPALLRPPCGHVALHHHHYWHSGVLTLP